MTAYCLAFYCARAAHKNHWVRKSYDLQKTLKNPGTHQFGFFFFLCTSSSLEQIVKSGLTGCWQSQQATEEHCGAFLDVLLSSLCPDRMTASLTMSDNRMLWFESEGVLKALSGIVQLLVTRIHAMMLGNLSFRVENSCTSREKNCEHCPGNGVDWKNGVLLYKRCWSVRPRKNPKCHHGISSNIRCTANGVRGDWHIICSWHTEYCNVKNEEEYYFWIGRILDESC